MEAKAFMPFNKIIRGVTSFRQMFLWHNGDAQKNPFAHK